MRWVLREIAEGLSAALARIESGHGDTDPRDMLDTTSFYPTNGFSAHNILASVAVLSTDEPVVAAGPLEGSQIERLGHLTSAIVHEIPGTVVVETLRPFFGFFTDPPSLMHAIKVAVKELVLDGIAQGLRSFVADFIARVVCEVEGTIVGQARECIQIETAVVENSRVVSNRGAEAMIHRSRQLKRLLDEAQQCRAQLTRFRGATGASQA